MALTPVGSTTGTNSHALPAGWAPGDLAITFAYRDGNTTPPTLPGTFTNIVNGGGSTNSSRSGVRVLQSGDTTFTWTNATSVVCLVYRPSGGTASVGASARGSGSSSTITYPAVSLQDGSGSSWVLRFAGHRSTDVAIETVPSGGFTFRTSVSDATDEAAGFDTNGGVTSISSGTASVGGTASGFEAQTIELRFHPARDALTYRDSDSGGDSTFTNSQITVPAPTVAVGDLEVIWAAAAFFAPTAAPTLVTPAGWNAPPGGHGASTPSAGGVVNTRAHMFWRIAPDTGSSADLDAGAAAVFVWARASYSNPDPSDPLRQVVFGSNGSANSSVLSSLNAVLNSTLSSFLSLGAAQTVTAPGSMTEREDNATFGVSVAEEQVSATAPTGTRTFTYSTATEAVWGFAEFQGPLSASAVDLVIANAAHGHAADAVALTSATVLATDGATHAQAAQSPTLGTETALSVSDTSHAHQAGEPTLSTDSVLTTANAAHAHAAESPALSADSTLVVDDALHGQQADAVTLETTVGTTLSVANAAHTHLADAVALSAMETLAIADALHGHLADHATLTVDSTLVVADAVHAHTADALTLSTVVAANLVIDSATHEHEAEVVTLGVVISITLSIDSTTHVHTAETVVLTLPGGFPDPADVREGVAYGPTGVEFVGTLKAKQGTVWIRRR